MGSGGGAPPVDKDQQVKDSIARHTAYEKIRQSNGASGWDSNPGGQDNWVKPGNWDQRTDAQKQAWFESWDKQYSAVAKDPNGVNFTTGQMNNAPAAAPDLTDQLLQKTRTSFAQRLQIGRNRSSSMNGTQLGGFDLSKPVLGGH